MTPAHDRLGLLLHPIDRGSSPLEKTQGGGGYLRADPVSRNEGDPIRRDGLEVHSASLALASQLARLQWLPDLTLNPLCLNFFGVGGEEPGEARNCHKFGASGMPRVLSPAPSRRGDRGAPLHLRCFQGRNRAYALRAP